MSHRRSRASLTYPRALVAIFDSVLFLTFVSATRASEPADPNVRAYSDTVAALKCEERGFRYFVRLMPNRPEVMCLMSAAGVEKHAVDVREVLKK